MKKHYLISLFLFLHFFSALANTNALKKTKPISILWEMGANDIESGYYENKF